MQAYGQSYYSDHSSQQHQQQQHYYQAQPAPQYGRYGLQQEQQQQQQQQQHYGVQQHYGMQQHQQQPTTMMQNSASYQQSSSLQAAKTTMGVFGQDPFSEIMPSNFPPGTDPKIVECFNRIDRDGNGVVDDRELQAVLSSCNYKFSMRTVHLLMYDFTHTNRRTLGPKEFVPLMKCLQSWRTMFQRFDRNRDGTIDSGELGVALTSLGFTVSPVIVNLLISKFTKDGHKCSLHYDSFIECCLTVRGLTEAFQARADCGKATFGYEEFLLIVLPFIIA